MIGLLTNIVAYGGMYLAGRYRIGPEIQFLNRMAICFGLCLAVMWIITMIRPLPQPVEFKKQSSLNLTSSKGALVAGVIIVIITLAFYVIFSPIGIAK